MRVCYEISKSTSIHSATSRIRVVVINKMHAGCLNGHNDFYSQNFINIDGINL